MILTDAAVLIFSTVFVFLIVFNINTYSSYGDY